MKDAFSVSEENRQYLRLLIALTVDYTTGKYIDVPMDSVNGIFGTLSYWAKQADAIPDNVTVLGYVDDEVILEVCVMECASVLNSYQMWRAANKLNEEIDPLVEYLNTVIGDDESLRKEEIIRLSKLYNGTESCDEMERARYALAEIL